jgi:hypothetical protein
MTVAGGGVRSETIAGPKTRARHVQGRESASEDEQ